jgi:hypothetical protein
MDQGASRIEERESWLTRLRSAFAKLDVLMGVLLAAMLLPLIIGPFVLVYQFARDGAYGEAGLVGGVFAACVALVARAVRRGDFGPSIFGAALLLLVLLALFASRLPH